MITDLKDREPNIVTPFVLEICTIEQLEKDLPGIGYQKESNRKNLVNSSRTPSCKKKMIS